MDWVRFGLGIYLVVIVLATATTILSIDRPRGPIGLGAATLSTILNGVFFVALLAAWQRLG